MKINPTVQDLSGSERCGKDVGCGEPRPPEQAQVKPRPPEQAKEARRLTHRTAKIRVVGGNPRRSGRNPEVPREKRPRAKMVKGEAMSQAATCRAACGLR